MEANLAVHLEDEGVDRDEIESLLREIRESHPEVDIEIEEPKGAFPIGDPLQLVIAVNASAQLIAFLYPRIKDRFSKMGGNTSLLDIDEMAIEYLDNHTRVTQDQLDLMEKRISDDYAIFIFAYQEDGSEHYIKINTDNPADWEYNER